MYMVDIHAHAFPDAVAAKAMPKLEQASDIRAALDGTVASLLASMDRAGIAQSVVGSIATRPEQFQRILDWSRAIASDRLLPFPSVHPEDPCARERVVAIRDAGFLGIKLHPYYQEFELDEERAAPIYETAQDCGLAVLMHTGFDIGYPFFRCADPVRVVRVLERFPGLKLITSHMGGWMDWDEARAHILGKPIYMDFSYSISADDPRKMPLEQAREFLLAHPAEFVLFGTDSPWDDPSEAVETARRLELGPERERLMFGENARRLLDL